MRSAQGHEQTDLYVDREYAGKLKMHSILKQIRSEDQDMRRCVANIREEEKGTMDMALESISCMRAMEHYALENKEACNIALENKSNFSVYEMLPWHHEYHEGDDKKNDTYKIDTTNDACDILLKTPTIPYSMSSRQMDSIGKEVRKSEDSIMEALLPMLAMVAPLQSPSSFVAPILCDILTLDGEECAKIILQESIKCYGRCLQEDKHACFNEPLFKETDNFDEIQSQLTTTSSDDKAVKVPLTCAHIVAEPISSTALCSFEHARIYDMNYFKNNTDIINLAHRRFCRNLASTKVELHNFISDTLRN